MSSLKTENENLSKKLAALADENRLLVRTRLRTLQPEFIKLIFCSCVSCHLLTLSCRLNTLTARYSFTKLFVFSFANIIVASCVTILFKTLYSQMFIGL